MKITKLANMNENLTDNCHFEPVGAETLGSWGPRGLIYIFSISKTLITH